MFRLRLFKEDFKFSSSHFTILGDDKAEALHGHNYRLSLEAEFQDDKMDSDFEWLSDLVSLKAKIREICARLDEKVLIPADSEYVSRKEKGQHLEVSFADRTYRFPQNEVVLLPVKNISMEALARYLCKLVDSEWPKQWARPEGLSVEVQESSGQSISWCRS